MKFIKNHILLSLAAMSLCVVAVSCAHDDFDFKHGDTLPEGKFPLKLTAAVDGMVTRASDTDFWDDGDKIRVRIGEYPWVGNYELNADGTVKDAIDPLAWPHTDDYV